MKYYIIAGEVSGDLHASNMMKEIKKRDTSAYFRVWGGDRMASEAQELAKHIRETSFMGIFKVLWNIRSIKKNFRYCEADIQAFQPDVLILIDNSGFNLRIAKYVKQHKLPIRVFYYILPQAWAWKRKRVHTIHQWCDRIFAILPFEPEFYRSYGYEIDYVGHPILDSIANRKRNLLPKADFRSQYGLDDRPIVALLPGSRRQEIKSKLPIMARVIQHFPDHQFVIAGSDNVDQALYAPFASQATLIINKTYNILNNATAALVTSGTATLETALFEVPQVVCYKPGFVTYHMLKRIISIKYICMVNLILDKMAVQELIESDLNEKRLVKELNSLMDESRRTRILSDYEKMHDLLGGEGASERVAELMLSDLETNAQ